MLAIGQLLLRFTPCPEKNASVLWVLPSMQHPNHQMVAVTPHASRKPARHGSGPCLSHSVEKTVANHTVICDFVYVSVVFTWTIG
jgi:hypothetical protein